MKLLLIMFKGFVWAGILTTVRFITAFTVIALGTTVNAAEIMIDGVKFEGTSEAIEKYSKARNTFDVADKHYANIRNRYTKQIATIQDYCLAQKSFEKIGEKMHLFESDLVLVPSVYSKNFYDLKPEEKIQLYSETSKFSERLHFLRNKYSDTQAYEQWLKSILPKFQSHSIEGIILFELGRLNESSYNNAVFYYSAVTKCSFPSDFWGFTQQAAWKRLAVLYEKKHLYQKAIYALKKWKISEPCGTGAGSSEIWRQFEIWRLSMYIRNKEKIRSEMWSLIVSGKMLLSFMNHEELAECVVSLYSPDDLDILSNQLSYESKKIEEIDSNDLTIQSIKKEFPKFASLLEKAIKKSKN